MKPCIKFFFGLVAALAFSIAAQAATTLSVTGIAASPNSAGPGSSVNFTVTASNADTLDFVGTASFTIRLTHTVTGATFDVSSGAAIAPNGGLISKASVDAVSGQTTLGTGSFTFAASSPTKYTEAGSYTATVTMTVTGGNAGVNSFTVSSTVLTITGNPDLQITGLTYAAGTSYVGGTVIPMTLSFANNPSTNGVANVPYLPGLGFSPTVRVKVVLSSNPTFGDADDFQLTIYDISSANITTKDNAGNPAVASGSATGNRALLADGIAQTISWNQILPGNFSGSYYVLAKIDSLDAVDENDPASQTVNGNNIWGGNQLNPSGTLINLLPSNFPANVLATHGNGATTSANGYSDNPSLSSDGRYVTFASDATNLIVGDTNAARDIFIFDSQTLLVRRLSVSQQGTPGNGPSNNPAISADGRYVAFGSEANNLVFGDTNGFSDIYVVDTITGLISRVSLSTAGAQANNPSFRPAISQNGRFIVFESTATNLDTAYTVPFGSSHIYLVDRDVDGRVDTAGNPVLDVAGNVSTHLVDADFTAPGTTVANGASIQAAISADGSVIAFASKGTNLIGVAGTTAANRQHVYLRPYNVATHVLGTTKLVSVVTGTTTQGDADSQTPSLTANGKYIAFASLATNLVTAGSVGGVDANGVSDIFVYDNTGTGTNGVVSRMSLSSANVEAVDSSPTGPPDQRLGSINPTISSDGRYVAFASLAGNLTAGDSSGQYQAADSNSALDIFVRDRDVSNGVALGTPGAAFDTAANVNTQMVSVNTFGYQTNGLLGTPSTAASNIYPVISANGRFVAFPTDAENNAGLAFGATNLLPLDSNGLRDVFLFDRRTNATISPNSPPVVTITSPGNGGSALVNTAIPITASATAATAGGTPIGVVSSVQFFVNGTSLGSTSTFPYAQTWTPTAVGNYTLSAIVTDSFGNQGASTNVVVTINAAPSVGISSPVAGAQLPVGVAQTVTATAGASNPGATISSVEFFVDGVSLGTDLTAPYSVSWTPAVAGTYTLTAKATDSVGTATPAPLPSVVVTVTAPSITITSPASASSIATGSAQTITASASSPGATVTSVQFYVDGVAQGALDVAAPFSASWTPAAVGTYSLTATGTDSNGVTFTSPAVSVSVTLAGGGGGSGSPKLSATGITASPGSANPGDTVTFAVAVSNSGASAPTDNFAANATANFSITLTNIVTGSSFTILSTTQNPSGVTPVSGISGSSGGGVGVTAAPGIGSFNVTAALPTQTVQAGSYRASVTILSTSYGGGSIASPTFSNSNSILTITGKPDLQITSLTYAASTSYIGGAVIPMQLTYRNNDLTPGGNNNHNVPYVPTQNGDSANFFRIQVVLSSNPTFGDADDFQLTTHDVQSVVNADSAAHTINWNQVLPGNFPGSYYVLAKIDSLDTQVENDPAPLTVNGDNVWGGNTLNPSGTLINLLPSNFPAAYVASHGTASVNTASGYSDNPSISADGRYMAFASDATNLVVGDSNAVRDIFLYDSQTTLVRRLSVSQQGAQANGASNNPAISADGRYVAFASVASNLIIGDTNGFSDIYVVDTITGLISRVSLDSNRVQANNPSFRPAVSQTGRFVVFESTATNLDSAYTVAPGSSHIYLIDRDVSDSKIFDTPGNISTKLVDVDFTTPATAIANGASIQAAISADGSVIAFASKGTNLIGVAGSTVASRQHVYLRSNNVATHVLGATTLVSVVTGTTTQGDADSQTPSLTLTGNYVAFASLATNLLGAGVDTNGVSDIFVYDNTGAATNGVVGRMSVSSSGVQGVDPSAAGFQLGSINPTISSDGRYVAFASLDNNLTAGDSAGRFQATDANAALDIFVRDRQVSGSGAFDVGGNTATTMVSVNSFGYQTAGLLGVPSTAASNIYPVISADGRFVAYPSDAENSAGLAFGATNQLPLDSNSARDVFLFDRRTTASISPNSPPSVTITSPGNNGTALVNTAISVTASATAATIGGVSVGVVSNVQFFVNGTSIGTSNVFPYGQTWTPVAVGTYTLSAIVTDSFGNLGVSPNVTVRINAAPSVGISAPVAGATFTIGTSTPITVSATAGASNPGGSITGVQFYANGASIGAGVLSSGLYSVTWTPATAGAFSLSAIASELANGQTIQTTSPAVSITVLNAGGGGGGGGANSPTVQLSATASTPSPVNVPITLNATPAAPTGFTVTNVQFFVNGSSLGTFTSAPYTVNYTPSSAGAFAFTAVVTDSSGSTGTTAPVTVNVTGVAPTVAFGLAVPSTLPVNLPHIFTATATPASGYTITQVQYFANGVSIGSAGAFPYTTTWTPTSIGTYTVTAIATDNIGSRSVAATASVTVTSGTAPTIPFTSPTDGASYAVGNPITVAATAALGSGLVTGVQFFANGVSIGSASGLPFSTTFTPAASGTYVFTAIGTDSSGNAVNSTPVSVTVVGATAPVVAISSPANNASLPVNVLQKITVAASSSTASLANVDVTVNGVSLGIKTAFPYIYDWTPTSEGTYAVIAVATDSRGAKSTSVPFTYRVAAAAAPTVSLSAPLTGSSYPVGNPIAVTASATAASGVTIASVQFFANGVSLGSKTAAPYTVTWTPSAAGNYSLSAIATDSSGAQATSTAIAVAIGLNAPPTVALTSPAAPGTYALGSGVLLSASAADSDGTVASVQFFANGQLLSTATTAPYTFSWVPQASGTYQITASATDNSGNVATTAQRAVTISSAVSTTVTITNPTLANGAYPVGNAIPFVASVTGGNGPIVQVQFFVNGVSLGAKTAAPYVVQWTPAAPGTYSLLAVATDSAGISTNSSALSIAIAANAAPAVALTSPATGTSANAGALVSLSALASDPDGTVASVRFLANGNVVATATSAPYIGTWIPLAAGTYSVSAQATDNSGNVANSASVLVNIFPNQSPTVALTSPASGSTVRVGSSVTLTATAGDVDGTVTSVQFFANGVSVGTDSSPPYATQWTPTADGIYRLIAVAIDNSGAVTTTPTVLAIASSVAGDTVSTGTYQGVSESGNFAVITALGKTAVFIGYSTSTGANKTYLYAAVPVDVSGGYNLTDTAGTSLISGSVSDTGTSGNFDGGRLTFIGIDTKYQAGSSVVASGYYKGTLTGKASSSISAIVGADGSIMLYVVDGSFNDAGGGGISGKLTSTGTFNVTTVRGNRFTGSINPTTGVLSGTLSGTNGGAFTGAPAVLGVETSKKVAGAGREIASDIYLAAKGNTYDQVLLTGASATITADPGQVTRISYVDLTNDIVQVEFTGAGALSITLDNASGPAVATNYNQPDVAYMKGHAGIVITGANETTNVSVFSVGRYNSGLPTIFKNNVAYDGVADLSYLVIVNTTDGKFGGLRTANASYFATKGLTGICAPGVQFVGPVYVGDINASDAASPLLLLGSASEVQINGGDLLQTNGKAVQVSGLTQLRFVDGMTSHGNLLPAQSDRSRLEENGADVTASVVVNPSP